MRPSKWPSVRATFGRRSGPTTISATSAMTKISLNPISNMGQGERGKGQGARNQEQGARGFLLEPFTLNLEPFTLNLSPHDFDCVSFLTSPSIVWPAAGAISAFACDFSSFDFTP